MPSCHHRRAFAPIGDRWIAECLMAAARVAIGFDRMHHRGVCRVCREVDGGREGLERSLTSWTATTPSPDFPFLPLSARHPFLSSSLSLLISALEIQKANAAWFRAGLGGDVVRRLVADADAVRDVDIDVERDEYDYECGDGDDGEHGAGDE